MGDLSIKLTGDTGKYDIEPKEFKLGEVNHFKIISDYKIDGDNNNYISIMDFDSFSEFRQSITSKEIEFDLSHLSDGGMGEVHLKFTDDLDVEEEPKFEPIIPKGDVDLYDFEPKEIEVGVKTKVEITSELSIKSAYIEVFNSEVATSRRVYAIDGVITITLSEYEVKPELYVVLEEVEPPKPPVRGDFIKAYTISQKDLLKLSKVHFIEVEGTPMDYGRYVLNNYKYPIKISDKYIGDKEHIYFGEYNSTIDSPRILEEEIESLVAEIDVDSVYNNAYDYVNTEVTLHLPFTEVINLPSDVVVGYTIKVYYNTDLMTGDTTINVYSSNGDVLVYSTNVTFITNIPFFNIHSENTYLNVNSVTHNRIKTPHIVVTRNRPYNSESYFGKPVIEFKKLGECKDFVRVENVGLETNATNFEKNEIELLLKNGVDIK